MTVQDLLDHLTKYSVDPNAKILAVSHMAGRTYQPTSIGQGNYNDGLAILLVETGKVVAQND